MKDGPGPPPRQEMRPKVPRPSVRTPQARARVSKSFLHRLTSSLLHDDRFTHSTEGSDRDGAAGSGLADDVEGG